MRVIYHFRFCSPKLGKLLLPTLFERRRFPGNVGAERQLRMGTFWDIEEDPPGEFQRVFPKDDGCGCRSRISCEMPLTKIRAIDRSS